MSRFLLSVLLLVCLSGCTSVKNTTFPDNYANNLPENVRWPVKHIPQNDNYSCAVTALTIVMSYYDETMYSKSEVFKASGASPQQLRNRGNDMGSLKRAAEEYGFDNYEFVIGMTLDELKYLVSKNLPVIVNIRNWDSKYSHAVVISGYDENGVYITDSGRQFNPIYHKSYKDFLRNWTARLSVPDGRYLHSAFILYPKKS